MSKYYNVVYVSKFSKYVNSYKNDKNFTITNILYENLIKLIHNKVENRIIIFDCMTRDYIEKQIKTNIEEFYNLLNNNFLCTIFLGDE